MEKKTRTNRKYDAQFKQAALSQIENGRSIPSVAQGLGISEGLLYHWRKRASGSVSAGQQVSQEVAGLRKQIKQLEMERDILKKALTIFSQPI